MPFPLLRPDSIGSHQFQLSPLSPPPQWDGERIQRHGTHCVIPLSICLLGVFYSEGKWEQFYLPYIIRGERKKCYEEARFISILGVLAGEKRRRRIEIEVNKLQSIISRLNAFSLFSPWCCEPWRKRKSGGPEGLLWSIPFRNRFAIIEKWIMSRRLWILFFWLDIGCCGSKTTKSQSTSPDTAANLNCQSTNEQKWREAREKVCYVNQTQSIGDGNYPWEVGAHKMHIKWIIKAHKFSSSLLPAPVLLSVSIRSRQQQKLQLVFARYSFISLGCGEPSGSGANLFI